MLQYNKALEQISLNFLAYIAQDPQKASDFFIITGLNAENLRSAVDKKDFAIGIVEYLMSDDKLLLDFSRVCSVAPSLISDLYNNLTAKDVFKF